MKPNMTCPKCGTEQPVADQCISCGIYIEKYYENQRRLEAMQAEAASSSDDGRVIVDPDDFKIMAILAAVGAAVLGALLWQFIATSFGYELGVVAWAIGGAVGFVAAMMGGRGLLTGIICGVLAFGSIFGGKYLAADSIKTEMVSAIQELQTGFDDPEMQQFYDEEMRAIYEEVKMDARLFSRLTSESEYAQFMVDRDYTEASSAAGVSGMEVREFIEYTVPELQWFTANNPSFREWQDYNLNSVTDMSTMEWIKEDLGWLDIVFIVLGVGTAFRLGVGSDD